MIKAIFPGTFDPIHNGHLDIATRATKLVDELVLAVYSRPMKNLLFSGEERLALAVEAFADNPKIHVESYDSLTIEFAREINAHVIVRGLRVFSDFEFEFRMALANTELHPGIETMALITSKEHTFLSSSTVREIASLGGDVSSMVPAHVNQALIKKFSGLKGDSPFSTNSLRD
ncbi:MAG: pantetheine-phosphate adenylyltransferase [Anaerolineales bacterium]|nr:pantetheine-phosphate adenylyltransferase [Anaerolineales bacterium]